MSVRDLLAALLSPVAFEPSDDPEDGPWIKYAQDNARAKADHLLATPEWSELCAAIVAEERERTGLCGCRCNCHADEGKPEWPGSCAGCCDPELTTYDCKCAAYLRGYRAAQAEP